MRIASVSDLHVDFADNREVVVKLATEIHRRGADVVIVAGDVSHKNHRIATLLRAMREVAPTVAYIPGNHDLWYDVPHAAEREDLNTWHRYHFELRDLVRGEGVHYLPSEPLRMQQVAIVGSCGWYDYSLAQPSFQSELSLEALSKKTYSGLQWSDARFICFRDKDGQLMADVDVARAMERELEEQVMALDRDPQIQNVVAVTHHLPFYEVVKRTGTLPWEFFNAFMGSTGLGRVLKRSAKIRHAIYGHTHITGSHEVAGIRVFGTPLGYPRERAGLNLQEVLDSRIGWLEFAET